MDIKYNHLLVEENKNKKWVDNKYFSLHNESKSSFSIILPPPNVTGKLHLGHAWDSYLQDLIIRYKKLQGFDVCFVPGMDHAGIATQAKVEQKLLQQNIDKHKLGREGFINYALIWKEEYANLIHEQWNKLGLALDYNFERFTLDNQSNKAVNKIFIDMYNKGLIYRDIKPINWDPKLKTAISNIEIISKTTNSKMYYVKYFFTDKMDDFIVVATTRIETIFSDVAIAINPNDKKNQHLIGKKVINPLNKKHLPIISDEYIDINFGTGFMKVSAHAVKDIDIINKNNLEIVECIDKDGLMNENALFVKGKTREEARIIISNFLEKHGNIDSVSEIVNNVSCSERSGEIIEILIMPQWFVKMDGLAQKILDNLNTKNKVKIYPFHFEKILERWMKEIKDWTISRQLWWGHRIPAWYKDGNVKVQVESPGKGWVQDEDVLDTWFSSALCPFSFLGWPDYNKNLERFFPTSLLVTGYDIIFFWVARMYFQSLEFMNNIPFKELLIHGLIRDENGKKMSKSLGNGIDPMNIINEYGSDSLRWYLITNSTPGHDINFSTKKLDNAWALNNKLWNICRFIKYMEDKDVEISSADIWITNKLLKLKKNIDQKIKKYEFTLIGKDILNFVYNDFSSWYIEFSKLWCNKKNALKIVKNLLILLHPFLPFLTDHLYKELFNEELLDNKFSLEKLGVENQINLIIDVVTIIREARHKYNISNKQLVKYEIKSKYINSIVSIINKLTNAEYFVNNGALFVNNKTFVNIYLSDKRKEEEKNKLLQEIKKIESEILRSKNILNNSNFMKKASLEKIVKEKEKYKSYKNKFNALLQKLESFN